MGPARQIAEVLQRVRPDVVLLNEFNYDANGTSADLFQANYLSVGQRNTSLPAASPIEYPYRYVAESNTFAGKKRKRNAFAEYDLTLSPTEIREKLSNPEFWETKKGIEFFDSRSPTDNLSQFEIPDGAYMPLGDNSPQSLDARLWYVGERPYQVAAPPYVRRDLISGRAMLIYWPHSWNWPPFWPNFRRMGFIH